jgi:hypothetical protein
LKDVPRGELPAKTPAERPTCFINYEGIAIFCEWDIKLPLGFYRFNLKTGKALQITHGSLDAISFIPDCPF